MPWRIVLLGVVTLLLSSASPSAVSGQGGDFSLEQVMSAPFPSELAASPLGSKVAWVFNAQGVRNIWVAEGPDFSARPLTAYAADDGQGLSDLAWTLDGNSLVYVRGGAPNRRGEYPNPLSRVGGVTREIWIVGLDGEEPVMLAEGSSPAVSPRGDGVAYLKDGTIWWVELAGGDPEPLVKARGRSRSLRWSPGGERLAFVSDRGDHSFIGVLDLTEERVVWLDPGVDRDVSPAWSPDGERVAFIRLPAEGDRLPFGPEQTGPPWSLRVVDSDGGSGGRAVWAADEGTGSVFRGLASENQLVWTADGRLVFPWEKEGWLHLYSVSVRNGKVTQLTRGQFEVEYVSLSADGRRVTYNSNQGDIDRRHLWSVPVDGGEPLPLTEGNGIEWSPTPLAEGDAVVFLRSDARWPARPAVRQAGGQIHDLAREAIPADFPVSELVEPQAVVFPAADGVEIRGQLFLSDACRGGAGCPGVLFFHGGSRRQMLLGWHYMGYYHNAYALNQYLADRGFVVLSVNYRSGIGYGMEFREAMDYGATGASEYNDVEGAGLYLRDRPEVDAGRLGLWGGSYGGYLTALGLARASDLFAAGVDFHGVHDWNVVIENFVPDYDPLDYPEAARVAFEASPMADIDRWRSPVLLIHGDDDRNVPFSETVDLAQALRARGVDLELLVFPDEVHGFLTHERWLQAYRATADFLARKLRESGRRVERR